MSNMIQHYSFKDMSVYGQNIKLNTTIEELNSKQNEERRGGFAVVSADDTATMEISELARTMYSKSSEISRYSHALEDSVKDFADFSMKITYGNYNGNDVSVNDLNFAALDKMENVYQSYRQQIETAYSGDEQVKHFDRLDEAYNTVFEEKVINTVKSVFDDKLTFFQPDSEETVKSIRAASTSKEKLEEMVSGYLANQAVNKKQYTALSEGTKNFYDMVKDTSLWHDTAAVKNTLTDSMSVYSSVKEVKTNSAEYISAKAAADEIAKKISDKYAENIEYNDELLGLKKDGKDTEWSRILNGFTADTSSGMFFVDFSKIEDLSLII